MIHHWPVSSLPEVVMTATEIIAIAFCCFLLVALCVAVACVYRMFGHKQGMIVSVCMIVKNSLSGKCVTNFSFSSSFSHPSILPPFSVHAHIDTAM